MAVLSLSADEALALATRTEDELFDRKSSKVDGRGLQKIAVALANANGGEVTVGIADSKEEPDAAKRWSGLSEPEDFNGLLQALFSLNPFVEFRYEFCQSDAFPGTILRLYIDKIVEVAKTADGKVYQRVGASSQPITDPAKITALAFAKGAASYENIPLANVDAETVVDSDEMARFCAELIPAQEPLAFCVNEGLIDRKTFSPCVAGLLLYGDNPSASFPKRCAVKIVFYDTKLEKPEREHLKINESISGPLYQLAHKTAARVAEIMSSISIMGPDGLKTVDYPPEAIWEILVNALIHRDYSIADDVQVIIYQNRIEIRSPGKLPGFVTTENYLDVRYSRNAKIVRSLARYKNPPNKDLGEGLNTAFDKMKEWRLKDPVLREEGNYVIVTIPHTPLATPEEMVIEYLGKYPEIRNADAREMTGIHSENQMKDVFYRLRDKGLIERVPGKLGNAAAWKRV
jgi:ATP-dependent DNA helicase RecG